MNQIGKKYCIEKLRNSLPIEITGEEYKGNYELTRESAQRWILNNLRRKYIIADTCEIIEISKIGAQKVTSHSAGNEAHLKSIFAIPKLIENCIFIEERQAEKKNSIYSSFRYYVVGLKIGNIDYTIKVTIGVKGDKKYYDHALTMLEKEKLIDYVNQPTLNGFKPNGAETTYRSYTVGKDTKLFSILQINNNMIPKIIHCCWLSGDPLPALYQECVDSWKKHMPEYEIMLWDMNRFPVDSVLFVKQAVEVKKWAYAADYIRLYALYHHGGIYLDMDVMVYKSFDPFLIHSAFSSVEFDPRIFYPQVKKKNPIGCGIEAAVLGAEKGHTWIRDIMDFYKDKEFINDPKYYWKIIMPRVLTQVSVEKYGFKYVPVYQVLDQDVHLYPPDIFSRNSYKFTCSDITKLGDDNPIEYSVHLCAHSWYEGANQQGFVYRTKKIILNVFGKKLIHVLQALFRPQKYFSV
ncbi:hypothetical protein AGMMS50262_10690 [Bacteroidia bacterium]|nr:hypothetical protein AGMMS50262_10690 [Bacteroidia bacterium]